MPQGVPATAGRGREVRRGGVVLLGMGTTKVTNLDRAIKEAQNTPAAYVLQSLSRHYLYKGSCRDLRARLKDHRAGRVTSTKRRRPLALVFYEYFDTYPEARRRELFLKTGAGRDFIAAQLKEENNFGP